MDISLLDKNGNLYEENIVRYVLIHEISHIICTEWGHTNLFYNLNDRMLYYMILIGYYKYEDYRNKNIKFGDTEINFNIL